MALMAQKSALPPPIDKFFRDVKTLQVETGWRIGQALFNHLVNVQPAIAEQLRGQAGVDPFFSEWTSDIRYQRAVTFIKEHWGTCGICGKHGPCKGKGCIC